MKYFFSDHLQTFLLCPRQFQPNVICSLPSMGPFFLPISILQHSLTYLASIMPKWKSKVLSGFKTSQPMSDIRKLWWLFWKWFIMLKLAKHLFSNKHRLFWLRVIWMQQLIVHLTSIFCTFVHLFMHFCFFNKMYKTRKSKGQSVSVF